MAEHDTQERAPDARRERDELLERLALSWFAEQRSRRRWGLFYRFLGVLVVLAVLSVYVPLFIEIPEVHVGRHTALVDVNGMIMDGMDASAERIVGGLQAAFEDDGTAAVVLRINSPGGSAVQSGYVYDEILRLREKYPKVPVYAVITDMGASGAYLMASAANAIYADRASLVGSIGVIMPGFGFVGAMEKLGVERRVLTAGAHKALLDPFSPIKEDERAYAQELLDTIHKQFIASVKAGRGDKLKDDPSLFSGLIWSGEEAVKLGLVDGLGSAESVAREVVGEKTLRDFSEHKGLLDQVMEEFGLVMANVLWRSAGANLMLQ